MIFGKKREPREPLRDVRALARRLAVPAAHVVHGDAPALSHFGGEPDLPGDVCWPERNGAKLGFLARLSLRELQGVAPIDWLPRSGALLFFYDLEGQPWGFDPKDRGAWSVLHVPDLAAPVDSSAARDAPVAFRVAGFRRIDSLPSWERPAVDALDLTDDESERYAGLPDEAFAGMPHHQVGGFPSPVQGDDMELESQLVSNGLYCGDPSGYEDPKAAPLRPGAADWRLLFQLDSDDELNVMWGDAGRLYFWVREQDARKGDFSGVWLVLQCG